ncbi:hypothetical protein X798_06479 [Onchocerca flexuosa]|uniref:Enhancer of mRNA-decapping protein 4 C-terminal domain-containing protein n=1 Tax=Onchocerca flexuosa TaxID=387005 RepID=A0A238BM64_9BILA|nr:hypothetical protein X798_06479 [Onchocerca flexuosa]
MDSVIQSLRATTIDNFKQQQNIDLHVIREELTNNIREVLMATMIPILQDVCVSLFQQLNENFRTGLDQYMKQIHTLCTSTLRTNQAVTDSLIVNNSSSADPSALINLIENQRITAAFEKAMMLKDFGALMFVCNNVDPDLIASAEQPLPQHLLLCLLNQLATKLEGETDLKFRKIHSLSSDLHARYGSSEVYWEHQYIENVLMILQVKDPTIAGSFRHVLNRLQTALTAYMGTDTNASLKRRARLISQFRNFHIIKYIPFVFVIVHGSKSCRAGSQLIKHSLPAIKIQEELDGISFETIFFIIERIL